MHPKLPSLVFWRAQARLEVSGDFWNFFLSPDTHSACPFFERGGTATCLHCGRQLWSAAGGPAGTAERATCSGEFVWKPAGWARALIRAKTEPRTADRHTRPLSHSQPLAHDRLPYIYIAFFLFLFSTLLPMRSLPPRRGLKSHFNCPFFAVWPSLLGFFVSHRCDVITNGPDRERRWIFTASLSLWFNWQERPTWTSLCTPLWLIYSQIYITVTLLNGPPREEHDRIFKNGSRVP